MNRRKEGMRSKGVKREEGRKRRGGGGKGNAWGEHSFSLASFSSSLCFI